MRRLSTNEFIIAAQNMHGLIKYDYSQSVYVNSRTEVKIICREHGEFWQLANNHLRNHGCPRCGEEIISSKLSSHLDEFILKAKNIHGTKYDYSKSIYVNNRIPLVIICPVHKDFEQTPDSHLGGKGCSLCATEKVHEEQRKDLEILIQQFIKVHGRRYDYRFIQYKNNRTPIEIICSKHGPFYQSASAHITGHNCPKCTSHISKPEIQWLDGLGVSSEHRQKLFYLDGKKIKVDAYVPSTNTVYEFYGDFWHGNPQIYDQDQLNPINKIKFGQLYRSVLMREKMLVDAGYNIVSIWEYDFKLSLKDKD